MMYAKLEGAGEVSSRTVYEGIRISVEERESEVLRLSRGTI